MKTPRQLQDSDDRLEGAVALAVLIALLAALASTWCDVLNLLG